jgi:hypothetical protein
MAAPNINLNMVLEHAPLIPNSSRLLANLYTGRATSNHRLWWLDNNVLYTPINAECGVDRPSY